jgi:hypothetical protein
MRRPPLPGQVLSELLLFSVMSLAGLVSEDQQAPSMPGSRAITPIRSGNL